MPTFPQFVRFCLARPDLFELGEFPYEWPELDPTPLGDELDRLEICLKSRSKFLAGDWPVDVKARFDLLG